jgi:hypothetical protein
MHLVQNSWVRGARGNVKKQVQAESLALMQSLRRLLTARPPRRR